MKKILLASLLALALSAGIGTAFAAPNAALPDVSLYDGKTLAQDNLSAGDWGGGSVADSTELFLFGGHSLKVTTLDLYQGAKINFLTPVPLAGSGRVFQVTLQRGAVTLHYDPQAASGAAPSAPQSAPGGSPGNFPGGRRGRGGRGGFGGRGSGRFGNRFRGQPAAPLIPLITKLRLEFTLADGRQADVLQSIPTTADTLAGDGWYSVNVPISSLKLGGSPALLKSVTLAGDQFGVFYIGRMQIASEASLSSKAPKVTPETTAAPAEEDTTMPVGDETGPPMGDQTGPPMGDETGPPMGDQAGPPMAGETDPASR